jgi:hypothetical protein
MAANGSSHTALEIFSKFRYVPLSGFFSPSAPLRLRVKSLLCFPFAGIVRHSRVPKTQKTLTPKLQPGGSPPSKFFQNSATFRSTPSLCPPLLRGEKFRYFPLSGFFSPSAPLRLRAKSLLCFPFAGIFRHSRAQKPRKPLRQNSNPQAHRPRNFFKIPLRSALLRLCALLSSVVKNSALFSLSSFKPRSGILRGNPPGSGRSFF